MKESEIWTMKSVLQGMRLKRVWDKRSKSSTVKSTVSVVQFFQSKYRGFAPSNTV